MRAGTQARRRWQKGKAMGGKLIYIVEDDPDLRSELSSLLALQGYSATCCEDFTHAAAEAVTLSADLAIVDLRLPGADGLEITRDVRAKSAVPVLVLTSSDREFDEVLSMRLGADCYLTKPYSPAVLLAHVERMLERAGGDTGAIVSWRGLSIDAARSSAAYGECAVELTRNELRILIALVRAQGGIVSRADLMYELWQSDEFVDDNTLTVNVNRLRKSLTSLGVPEGFLRTHRGRGYSL